MMREPYDPNFDAAEGLTESPDVAAARGALREATTGETRTEEAIAASRAYVARVAYVREKNHFTEKLRQIIQNQPPRSVA